MSMWALLIALVFALIVWYLIVRQLTNQPWLIEGDAGQVSDITVSDYPTKKVALYFFLAVISSLFALFFSAYLMRMDPQHGGDWHTISKPGILWINTVFLICASASMQKAKSTSLTYEARYLLPVFSIAGVFTLLFLGGQLLAWQQLEPADTLNLSNPALGFFYLLTGVHALHLLGGMYVWARAFIRILKGNTSPSIKLSIELCTVYWHYLLLVWLVLFGLLLTT
jgi:cytochrome c oxidase subunit 3